MSLHRLNIPQSERKNPILGLYLLFLLAEGRIGDFHTELELVADHHDKFIRYSIDLERDIMEGRYNKVWSARQNPPRANYTHLVDKLMITIRNDVASCIESSYENLTVDDAAKLLMFSQAGADFQEFTKSVRTLFHLFSFSMSLFGIVICFFPFFFSKIALTEFPFRQRDWVLDGMEFTFSKPAGKPELPSHSLIHQSLAYAHEIERII